MATINTNAFYTSAEAADVLGVTTDTVKKYCQNGTLQGIKVGWIWLIEKDDVKRYKEGRKTTGKQS